MQHDSKIKLLVVPDLFPKYKEDVQGIFLLDYLSCTAPFCENTVLFGRLSGQQTGISESLEKNTRVMRFVVTDQPLHGFKKIIAYRRWFRLGKKAAKQIRAIDIVHAHGSILSGTLAWMIAKKRKIPFVLTEHVGPFSSVTNSAWKFRWTKFIMQRADLVLCVSEHQKREILNSGIKPRRIEVSYNPVDSTLFYPAPNKVETKNFLFAGRLDNFKGGLRCVQAFAGLASKYPEWQFTIVGDGEDMPAINHLLEANPSLKNRIILTGQLNKAAIAEEMRQADFFVFPSLHESFGLVVAEALASGLPVITTNRTAPKEFVPTDGGILVDPENISELSAAIEKMFLSCASYSPAKLRSAIHDRFSFENFGKKLLGFYISLKDKR